MTEWDAFTPDKAEAVFNFQKEIDVYRTLELREDCSVTGTASSFNLNVASAGTIAGTLSVNAELRTLQGLTWGIATDSSTKSMLNIETTAAPRWSLYAYGAETDADGGNNLAIARFADNGTKLGDILTVGRNSRVVTIPNLDTNRIRCVYSGITGTMTSGVTTVTYDAESRPFIASLTTNTNVVFNPIGYDEDDSGIVYVRVVTTTPATNNVITFVSTNNSDVRSITYKVLEL